MNSFDEAMKQVDDIYAGQLKRLPELNTKLNEKFAKAHEQETKIYDILQAIIAREGGGQVNFRDGGRTCSIEILEDNRIKISYSSDFKTATTLKDAFISKDTTTEGDDPITDFQTLAKEYESLERYGAVLDLAGKVIDTYVSYQNGLSNYRTTLIDKITGEKDDEESYW